MRVGLVVDWGLDGSGTGIGGWGGNVVRTDHPGNRNHLRGL